MVNRVNEEDDNEKECETEVDIHWGKGNNEISSVD